MLKKANISWTAKQLAKMVANEKIKFDSYVQRGLCWKQSQKSLLIHSLMEGYPVPAFYSSKGEDGVYQFLDGKQRLNAIVDFINNKYELTDIPDVTTEDGEELNMNGCKFEDLLEDFQDMIKDTMFTIYYFENLTDDQIAEMFFRLNNGKSLTSVELSRVKAKSLDKIRELAKHELFTTTLTESAIQKYTNEDLVIKSYVMLTEEHPSLETKKIRPILETAEFDDDMISKMNQIFTRMIDAYNDILVNDSDVTLNKKIAKRMVKKTHLLSIVPITWKSINENVSLDKYIEFIQVFFSGEGKNPTINEEYNDNCTDGSATNLAVQSRLTAVEQEWNNFIAN